MRSGDLRLNLVSAKESSGAGEIDADLRLR